MSPAPRFRIDLNQKFPALEHAPILEAVIHWQAHSSKPLEQASLKDELAQRLPDYPICQSQHDVQIEALGTSDGSSQVIHRTQWNGLRLQDHLNQHVAQFTPKGVVFSRLKPYGNWQSFLTEAMRFWDIFLELARPTDIQRLGVRFINRISLENNDSPSTYLNIVTPPLPGLNLPTESFFHQDTYRVPDSRYLIRWVRTIQPHQSFPESEQDLIFDIDVFMTEFIDLDRESLIQRLYEMRWIKNKIFFNCITPTALERFGA
jgi:uncharacterized protein (TIGR04255 family)